MTRALLLALAGALLALLAGCGGSRAPQVADAGLPPWPTAGAPDALHALAEDLQAHAAATGRLPADLAQLDRSGMGTGGPYAALGYAYQPTGLGLLDEDWRLLAVDDRVRQAQHVWCVLRPTRRAATLVLHVALVPMATLRAAAAAK